MTPDAALANYTIARATWYLHLQRPRPLLTAEDARILAALDGMAISPAIAMQEITTRSLISIFRPRMAGANSHAIEAFSRPHAQSRAREVGFCEDIDAMGIVRIPGRS